MTDQPMTYAGSGVNYDAMDPFKRMAQEAARLTAGNIERLDLREVPASRGESAYLVEALGLDHYLAHVEEGLGTKNLVADAMHRITGLQYYDKVAQDTVAMIVNDLITLGALPISVAMHLAPGTSDWFEDEARLASLISGWQQACNLSRCVWGGGETPTLMDIVIPGTSVLSGSAVGIIKPKSRRILGNIADGDAIVMLASSGIHANGLTLARRIAERVGYEATLSDGRMFGEALLDPTIIYVPVIEDCQEAGIDLHYAVNITGHGFRKLMRAVEPFVYVINRIPVPQPVFRFIQKHGRVTIEEMYANLNMGGGFALYVAPDDADKVIARSRSLGIDAWVAGYIEKRGDEKKVVIESKDLEYDGSTLSVR